MLLGEGGVDTVFSDAAKNMPNFLSSAQQLYNNFMRLVDA